MQFSLNHEIQSFYEVSAKSGENVTEAFESFFRDIHKKVSLLAWMLQYWIILCSVAGFVSSLV